MTDSTGIHPSSHVSETPGGGSERPLIPLPPWDMYTVAACLISGYILIPLLVSNILTLTHPFLESTYQLLIQQAVTLVSWIAIFFFLGWRYRQNMLTLLGLSVNRPGSYYFRETLYVMLAMLCLILMMILWNQLTGVPPEKPYEAYSTAEKRVVAFFAVVSAPLLEELVFRGFVQSTFHKISPPARSVIFTCLAFLLFHGSYFENLQALIYVLILGLTLGYWRERTQSLIPGILGHLLNNILASFALFM